MLLLAAGILALLAPPVVAQVAERPFPFVEVPVWVELDPVYRQSGTDYPLSTEQAGRRALEEARYIVTGMVYGYRFAYVPADNARNVNEEFSLEPLAEVSWGDARLTVTESRVEGNTFRARVRYRLADFQRARLQSWQSGAIPERTGSGEAAMWDGPEEKITAIRNAVKQAVRSHLQGLTRNKPRIAEGQVLFVEPPRIYVDSGAYHADVRLKVRVAEIRHYEVF